MRKLSWKRILLIVLCAMFVLGGVLTFLDRGKTALVFSDVKVECKNRDGLLGGRYATFTITGTVTKQTWGGAATEETMPKLVAGDEDGEVITATLAQDRLSRGESCEFTYEHEFDITKDALPTLTYTCDLSTEGFDDVVQRVNTGLKGVVDEYARKDAEKKAAEEAAKKKAAEEEANKKAIEGCKGKTADEGLKAAKDAGFKVTFIDNAGADVTKEVEDSTNKSDIHGAVIENVDIMDFGEIEVTFTLDGEGAETKKAREEAEAKAAEEAKKKEEEDKVLTVENSEDLARLLDVSDPGDPFVAEFAQKYDGRKIEFDAIVADVQPHGNYSRRFDFLLYAGDGSRGPNFKFEDKNPGYDFHWSGSMPDSVSVDMQLHCIAEVEEYDDNQQLFFLDPVETSMR